MDKWLKVCGIALLISFAAASQASAGFFEITVVPEIDGSIGLAAMAFLASIGAIFFGASRSK